MKRKGNKLVFTRFEKSMFVFTILLIILSPVMSVCAKSILSKVNYEVEVTKEKIDDQEKNNQSLQMKINELASFDNVESVAEKEGLSYTSDSVKTIE